MKFFKLCSLFLLPIFSLLYLILWSQLQVQEAADCLGADCVPRYVEMKRLMELEIEDAFQAKQKVRLFPITIISAKCHLFLLATRLYEDLLHCP